MRDSSPSIPSRQRSHYETEKPEKTNKEAKTTEKTNKEAKTAEKLNKERKTSEKQENYGKSEKGKIYECFFPCSRSGKEYLLFILPLLTVKMILSFCCITNEINL